MGIIKVNNVHKSFRIYHDKGLTLKERILFKKRNHYEKREVLKGIDLSIEKGEVVGLIGENGSGKSTLLKILTRIIFPDKGSVEITGKVSSLLELGAGFHPDLSGKENIYMNASIYGLTKKEIDQRIDEIIKFSELREHIDNPVRTYSSGMYMRLAFSVAINVNADILFIDEILSVGDANFQAKCFNKLQDLKRNGVTIVLVSHDLAAIQRLCNRVVWLKNGEIAIEDKMNNVISSYLDNVMNKNQHIVEELEAPVGSDEKKDRWGSKQLEMKSIRIINEKNVESSVFKTNESISICIEFIKKEIINSFVIGFGFFRMDGLCIYGTNTRIEKIKINHTEASGQVTIVIDNFALTAGEYYLDLAIETEDAAPLDYYCECKRVSVYSDVADIGLSRLDHSWLIDGQTCNS